MKSKGDPVVRAQSNLGFIQRTIFNLRLSWRLLKDARVPRLTKLVFPTTLVYVLSPVDFIPDIVLGLGQLDDLAVLFIVGPAIFIGLCPKEIVAEHRRAIVGLPPLNVDDSTETVDGESRVVG